MSGWEGVTTEVSERELSREGAGSEGEQGNQGARQ